MTIPPAWTCRLLAAVISLAACGPKPESSVRLTTFAGAVEPYLAQSLGAFREAGLRVEIQAAGSTSRAMESLVGGSADVILGTYEQTRQLAERGKAIEAIYVLDTCHCLALVALRPEIRAVSDLAGKTIGVAGAGGQMQNFARHLLRKLGREASYAAIGVGPQAVAAIESGKVDAAVVLYSTYETLRARHPEARTLAETFSPDGMEANLGVRAYASKSLLAGAQWVAANPDAAAGLRRAFSATVVWMKGHSPEEIWDRLPAEARSPDRTLDLALLRLLVPLLSSDGAVPGGADHAADALLRR
jgi:NitT/TauT family transport system substrate-binding protein